MKNEQIGYSLKKKKTHIDLLLESIPSSPGCYLMKDSKGRILYIGKSKCLVKRVRSYFSKGNNSSPRILLMVNQVRDIEYIITDTEAEALTLESNLIKKYLPYFNVLLKDDKKYPYVCITWSDKYPRIYITRRRRNRSSKDKYYGPFVDVALLKRTINIVKKIFPQRQRNTPLFKDRTCLNYSIGRCPGVCQDLIDTREYHEIIKRISMIFEGRTNELNSILYKKMYTYSEKMEFENAQIVKEQIQGIARLTESQKMINTDSSINRDVIAYAINDLYISAQIFQMRSGKLIGRIPYIIKTDDINTDQIIPKVLEVHYSKLDSVEIPKEINIDSKLDQLDIFEQWLSGLKGSKVKLINPKRKNKAQLLLLVKKNAQEELTRISKSVEANKKALENLAELLDLPTAPIRIEGYDISHMQGSNAVGSQVVFVDGVPAKQHYRKYKIKNDNIRIGHSDDYLSIYEVIIRRFRRWSKIKEEVNDITELINKENSILDTNLINDFPDLVLIDGGKGQLRAAENALKELDLVDDINLCSIAKKNEDIYIRGRSRPLEKDLDQSGLFLLRRIRDESHRFAISFHRDKRSKNMRRSELSQIPRVGPKRIKSLLSRFNSIEAIRLASIDDLVGTEGVGYDLAKEISDYFKD